MEKVDRWKCLTCKYRYTENGYTVYCDYLGMTGKRRNCPYGMCDKYEDGRKKNMDFERCITYENKINT